MFDQACASGPDSRGMYLHSSSASPGSTTVSSHSVSLGLYCRGRSWEASGGRGRLREPGSRGVGMTVGGWVGGGGPCWSGPDGLDGSGSPVGCEVGGFEAEVEGLWAAVACGWSGAGAEEDEAVVNTGMTLNGAWKASCMRFDTNLTCVVLKDGWSMVQSFEDPWLPS